MATDQRDVAPEAFFEALTPSAPPRRHPRTGWLFASVGLVVVAAAGLVAHALVPGPAQPPAILTAFAAPQRTTDVLDNDDVSSLVIQPGTTRLLVRTDAGDHYAALSASGELCLLRIPDGDVPSEVCVPDRVGADVTIGTQGAGAGGQVRLVAAGAPQPSTIEGWRSAGANVWVRG